MANTKISQLPSYTGTAADIRWFVMNNSGESTTYKFSGYSSPYVYSVTTSGITEVNNTKSSQFNRLGGTNTEDANSYSNFIVGKGNTVGNSSKAFAVFGNDNTATGGSGVGFDIGSLIFGQNNSHAGGTGAGVMIVGAYNSASGNFAGAFGVNMQVGGYYAFAGGNNNNVSTTYAFSWGESNNLSGGEHQYSFGSNNDILTSSHSGIFGGRNNLITGSGNFSSIIGGESNTITRGTNCSIISSVNSTQNGNSSPYSTQNVTMIGCVDTDVTNTNNVVVLGVSGRTITGAPNTTYVDKLGIFGNTIYEATTFNDAGTCVIDIFNMSHAIINATGGTYTLTISPTPSQQGTPELTLLINVSGGATIAFDNSGNTQWRWGNGAGTPSFTNNTRSIIKMAAWDGNDLYEISRSLNMA